MVSIKIIAFGQLAEIIGEDVLNMEAVDTLGLQQLLTGRFPKLENKKYVLSVNKEIVLENTILAEGSTVALLPPFSGG